jgi:stearoyl-CoA desaturase (delta-9 desaturase)
MIFTGILNLPWWGDLIALLILVQITIAGVTVYLHRCQAHRALDLHPAVSHFFRLWMWLTTGMITKEWAAIHRKHHAKCETAEDPHSPQVLGINTVLWTGVMLYVKESYKSETMEKYGHGTPDDWLEKNVYSPLNKWGILIMLAIDIALFGLVPGAIIYGIQMAWIPFWAAGVINGVGHWFGYRNYACDDASTNITPWAFWIGGEELHNNHHAYPSSAKFSQRWYEFDIGWLYISVLQKLRLAKVKRLAPTLVLANVRPVCDERTLSAVIAHRYEVMARFAKSLKAINREEIRQLMARGTVASGDHARRLRRWMSTDWRLLSEAHRAQLTESIESSAMLKKLHTMREELASLWQRSTLSNEQLARRLEEWCQRAEASGIVPLAQFSLRLRRYA